MLCSIHDLNLSLFTENNTMFGDEECFGDMS